MKFTALLSGGKDSCYNIMKCQSFGHELVCLANLSPPPNQEEMNSFMYQSAAHCAIPHLAECFNVPLMRREIRGDAVCQTLDYSTSPNDEVEDLYELLAAVKTEYPEVQGVSCGAILSTYQRLRVEHVCQRLGLTVLSYLWQRNQAQLLDEMLASGVTAVLVKVAGAGLDPYRHLGKTLESIKPALETLHKKFGLDLCGEGGEYETLVLDCPAFCRRLVLDSTEIVLDEEDCSVGNLRIIECHTEEKKNGEDKELKVPPAMSSAVSPPASNLCQPIRPLPLLPPLAGVKNRDGLAHTAMSLPLTFSFPESGGGSNEGGEDTQTQQQREQQMAQQQTHQVMERLMRSVTTELGARCFGDAVFVHLYVSDMRLFAAVNEVYCRFFGTDPPSRSCVQVPLPYGVLVAADCMVLLDSHCTPENPAPVPIPFGRRHTLHVKSVSEWAPTCIGPYAQANALCQHLVLVAGQIPLAAATMTVWQPPSGRSLDGAIEQLSLSLQHAANVLACENSAMEKLLGCVVYVNMSASSGLPTLSRQQLRALGLKCGELIEVQTQSRKTRKRRASLFHTRSRSISESSGSDSGSGSDSDSDNHEENEKEIGVSNPPMRKDFWPVLVVGVTGIPRDCLVEAEVVAASHLVSSSTLSRNRQQGTDLVRDNSGGDGSDTSNWPLWSSRGLTPQAQMPLTSDKSSHKIDHISRTAFVCGGLCSSVLQIRPRPPDLTHSETPVRGDMLPCLADCLARRLHELLRCAKVAPATLVSLRVFYSPDKFDREAVVSAVNCAVASLRPHFPVSFVPALTYCVAGEEDIEEVTREYNEGLAAQVLFADLLQLRSNSWIAGRDS